MGALMLKELEAVLSDPAFARSPVLGRLLKYLVEESALGRGAALKSYTVAVEGLGKSSDYDPQVDTYARVIVGRLRKALDNFYASVGAKRPLRLSIDSGSYEVTLRPHGPVPAVPHPQRTWSRLRWLSASSRGIAAAGILAVLLMIVIWRMVSSALFPTNLEVWRTSNFPTISVSFSGNPKPLSGIYDLERFRALVLGATSTYPSVRPLYEPAAKSDYRIVLNGFPKDGGASFTANVVDSKNDRVIWSRTFFMKSDDDSELVAPKLSFLLSNSTGIINESELKKHFDTGTPYGCWLKFTAKVQTEFAGTNDELNQCAKSWYAAMPNHPLAAAIYGWTLVDVSISKPTEGGRRNTLQQAIKVLDRAKSLFPDSAFLHVSAARAYDFAGETEYMETSARRALELAPDNLDIEGAVGTMLVLRNLPAGEPLLDDALAKHSNPPSWYFIGRFMAAMMHEDTAAARKAIENAEQVDHALNLLPVLSAAHQARTGKLLEARKSWDTAKARNAALRFNPNIFLDRMPMSRDVRSRFKFWLAPLLS